MMSGNRTIIFTLFGATGDLAYRKLLPALYNLHSLDHLTNEFKIFAIGRKKYTQAQYHEIVRGWCEKFVRTGFNARVFDSFVTRIKYVEMRFDHEEDYHDLKRLYENYPQAQHMYYLAVASSHFDIIASHLVVSGCTNLATIKQCLIEKPFGTSLITAQQLNTTLLNFFNETEMYRIDHYLGKEMIQNLLSIRFENPILTPLWSDEWIDSIVIRALEEVGVESRGQYYDQFGAMKDMVQNHLFQILSLLLMKPAFTLQERIAHQNEIIQSLELFNHTVDDVVLGQYEANPRINDEIMSYTQEKHVRADSQTETFISLRTRVRLAPYHTIKVILQTGKRTHKRSTDVIINFKTNSHHPNQLIIKISPDEGVYLRLNIKKPGQSYDVETVMMEYCQSCVYENRINTPEAYERILKAAIELDKSLFTPWEMVASSWSIVDGWNEFIQNHKIVVEKYPVKTYGPSKTMMHIHSAPVDDVI